ncbi:hypothetical protein [Aurantibacter sp.]|uniref:hypothetical protein n=1 Tax=Aurantibacter sp. TaxID=2807103 RepID=UPI003267703B
MNVIKKYENQSTYITFISPSVFTVISDFYFDLYSLNWGYKTKDVTNNFTLDKTKPKTF